jgi:cytochrome b561
MYTGLAVAILLIAVVFWNLFQKHNAKHNTIDREDKRFCDYIQLRMYSVLLAENIFGSPVEVKTGNLPNGIK